MNWDLNNYPLIGQVLDITFGRTIWISKADNAHILDEYFIGMRSIQTNEIILLTICCQKNDTVLMRCEPAARLRIKYGLNRQLLTPCRVISKDQIGADCFQLENPNGLIFIKEAEKNE